MDVTLEMYRRCEKAFLREIVVTANIVLGKQPELSSDDRKRILKDLVFGLSTHLDNSSYSGEVDGVMVYPILWYDLGELEGSVRLKGSAAITRLQAKSSIRCYRLNQTASSPDRRAVEPLNKSA